MRTSSSHRSLRRWGTVPALAGVALLLASYGAGASTQRQAARTARFSGPDVVFDVFSPFSGANAFIGNTFNLPPVKMGVALINAAGGILGHKATVIPTDSGSDPTDAIPAMQRLLLQHSNVNGLLGTDSSNGPALAPVLNSHHIVTMSLAGTPSLDRSHYQYFWRLSSPDSLQGAAVAQAALHLGYKRVVLLFDSSGTSQSNVAPIVQQYKKHGGKILLNLTLPVDQASYRTEVERVKAAHPQAIISETDPQTGATLFANMKQLGLLGIPVIGAGENDTPQYFQAVAKSVGGMAAEAKWMYVDVTAQPSAPGLPYFLQAYKKAYPKAGAPVPPQYDMYDGLNIMAIAMVEAHSTDPSVYVKYIKRVTNNPGATVVGSYAQAVRLLKKGKRIQYWGAAGQFAYNQYQWPPSPFSLLKLTPKGGLNNVYTASAKSVGAYYFGS